MGLCRFFVRVVVSAFAFGAFLTSAAQAGSLTFTGDASAGFTRSPTISQGQFTIFNSYNSWVTWRYVMHTFSVDQTGLYNATSTTGPEVNTTYILRGTFAPNDLADPTTPLSNFVVGAFSGTTTATLTNVTLTAGQQYTALVVYDTPAGKLHKPADLRARLALEEAQRHYEKWMASSAEFQAGARFYIQRESANLAAFSLHQASEHLYHCVLLVTTLYSGKAHNLAFLRKKAEGIDTRLADAWPRETKFERRCFELLREAYVKARYSEHFKITAEELAWLAERVDVLRGLTATICTERLEDLRRQAEAEG